MKRRIFILVVIASLTVLLFLLKFDISSFLIKPAIEELKKITGQQVSINKAYVNFFPLYVEFRDVSISNKVSFKKIKLYIGLERIFNREVQIRRVVVFNGQFYMDYEFLNNLIENISNYLKIPTELPFKIKFNYVELENFSGSLNKDKSTLVIKDLYAHAYLKAEPKISILSHINFSSEDYPNIDTNFKVTFILKDNQIILKDLKLFDINSLVQIEGKLQSDSFLGDFFINGKIFFKSLLRFLGIENQSSGEINISGKILIMKAKRWIDRINLDIKFYGSFLLEELMRLLKVKEKLEGFTQISKGKVEGLLSNPRITAKGRLEQGNILGIKIEKAYTDIIFRDGILYFNNIRANLYDGVGNAQVWITLPKVVRHYVFVNLKQVGSEGIFELIHWNPGISIGKVDGWLVSEGEKFAPKGSFVYIKTDKGPEDIRGKIKWIKGDFTTENNIYYFSSLLFSSSQTWASASGYIDSKNSLLNFNFKGSSKDMNELFMPFQKGLHGEIVIDGKISGKLDNPLIDVNFLSNNFNIVGDEIDSSLSKQSFQFHNIKGKISYQKNLLVIHNISTSDSLSINGQISFPNAKQLFDIKNPVYDVSFSLRKIPIKAFYLEPLKDYLSTSVDINGNIKDMGIINANINSDVIFLGKNKIFDKLKAVVSLNKDSMSINQLYLYDGNNLLSAHGFLTFNRKIDINGKAKIFNITKFIENYASKIGIKYLNSLTLHELNFEIKGVLNKPDIKLNTELSARAKNGRTVNGTVDLALSENNLFVNTSLMKGIKVKVVGFLDKKLWNIEGQFNSVRIDPLVGFFINNLPEDFVALIDGKLESSILNNQIDALVDLNRMFIRIYGIGLSNKNHVKLTINKGNVFLNPVTFIGQSTELTVKGKIVDYFDILVEGYTDLRPFKALFKVDDIKGKAFMQVYIYESRKNPEIVGGIDINNASITLKKNFPSLNNLNAAISFNENRVLIEKASGNISEGSIQMSGTVYLENFNIKQLALSGKITDMRWIFAPRCWAYLDGNIYLSGDYSQPLLAGNLFIKKGVFNEKIDWTALAMNSSSFKSSTSKESWLSNLKLNLRVQVNDFFVNNNLALMSLKGDFLLGNNLSQPSLIGWINAKDGWIYFRNNKFEIMKLLIQFNDPNTIRPYLNISARTNVAQYNINLNLNGYIDQFNLILSSNPPLSENELLNILVLGQNGASQTGFSLASEATSFITGQMEGVIEERVRELTGLDVMTVEPSISKTTGSLAPRITLGKKLMDGKLSVTYSTSTGTTAAENIIKIEYLVKKGVSIVGTRDETGGISGAVKFRFEFR